MNVVKNICSILSGLFLGVVLQVRTKENGKKLEKKEGEKTQEKENAPV